MKFVFTDVFELFCVVDLGMKSASDSVLIMAQLADKERVFGFFLRFLEDADIFDKVYSLLNAFISFEATLHSNGKNLFELSNKFGNSTQL